MPGKPDFYSLHCNWLLSWQDRSWSGKQNPCGSPAAWFRNFKTSNQKSSEGNSWGSFLLFSEAWKFPSQSSRTWSMLTLANTFQLLRFHKAVALTLQKTLNIGLKPGLATNSIIFCWLFTTTDHLKKCFMYKHTIKVCVNCDDGVLF